MVITSNLTINYSTFINLFKNYKLNKKLFILTQCGSFSFYTRLNINVSDLPNSVYLCSTNQENICGIGAGILLNYSNLLNTVKHCIFSNMKSELEKSTIHFLDDKNNININDIFKLYKCIMFDNDNLVYLKANNKYLNYDISKVRQDNSIIASDTLNTNSIWILKEKTLDNYFKLSTTQEYTFESIKHYAYLDIFESARDTIKLWSEPQPGNPHNKQFFIIEDDYTLKSQADNKYLFYNSKTNMFTRKLHKTENADEHLVKIYKKIN